MNNQLARFTLLMLAAAPCFPVMSASESETNRIARGAGLNVHGQIGNGNLVDQPEFTSINGLTDVVQVASGTLHTLALRVDGTVWAWGNNASCQLGLGFSSVRSVVPMEVHGITNAVAVAAGHDSSLALLATGKVMAWGHNTPMFSASPVEVQFGVSDIVAIDSGVFHGIALRSDGQVFAWGKGNFGQLGQGTARVNPSNPALIPDLTNVVSIAAGHYHNLALRDDGTVVAWGQNARGQLGNDTTSNALSPAPVSSLNGVAAIAAGGMHSLALLNDGTSLAWGKNANGQLGIGTTIDVLIPQPIPSLNSIASIAAGSAHSVARRTDGILLAWGFNNYGQLGDGSQIDSSSPMVIAGVLGASAIACGDFQTFTVGRQPFCPADIAPQPNGDFTVNVQDLLAVISAWGACGDPKNCPADIAPVGPPVGDDIVNVQDLLAVIGAWGACP